MSIFSLLTEDKKWMERALFLANQAKDKGEIPVGAVVVQHNQNIAEGYNCVIQHHDPTAHAEIIALRQAGKQLENYRLNHATLYVTLEPCPMCMGAIGHARIQRLVFGAFDFQRGAVCNTLNLAEAHFLNHKIKWQGGILEKECSQLLKTFFQEKR